MKNEIVKITSGNWDAFKKALKHLSFLGKVQIYDSKMQIQIAHNSQLYVDFSGVLGGNINLAFLNTNNTSNELSSIPESNDPVIVYEIDNKYVFTNGKAYVTLNKYVGFNKTHDLLDYTNNTSGMGTPSANDITTTKTLFKITKNKGPIDLILVDDELVSVGNKFGARLAISKNTVKDILDTEPTSIYRAYSFDKFDGIEVTLDLLKNLKDSDTMPDALDTCLHAKIKIDTAIIFNFYERVIPISNHNWRR